MSKAAAYKPLQPVKRGDGENVSRYDMCDAASASFTEGIQMQPTVHFCSTLTCSLGIRIHPSPPLAPESPSPVPVLIESALLCCSDLIISRFLIDPRCLVRQCTRSLTKVINFHFVQGPVPIRSPGWGRQGG